jgi:cell division protein FtsB
LETTPSLGWSKKVLWKWTPACKTKEKALKKDLMSCNADLKSKIDARSAELGEPVRNGRALLGSKNTCASAMKEEQDLLAECKAELAVHDENTKLKAQNENLKGDYKRLKADLKGDYKKLKAENENLKAENEKLKAGTKNCDKSGKTPKAENEKPKVKTFKNGGNCVKKILGC